MRERERNCAFRGKRWGLVEGAGRGGVSNITLMNQCQRSDEKIIKKQASAVLNTAKGKRPILLDRSTICTGGGERMAINGIEGKRGGRKSIS